jgi:protein-disulfide isomerase
MKPITAILLALVACLVGVTLGFRLGQSSTGGASTVVAPTNAAAPVPVPPPPPAPPPVAEKPAEARPAAAPETPASPETPAPPGIDFKGSPAVGDPSTAKVIVFEFSDFQCPVCKRAADELHPMLGSLAAAGALIVFKQNPLEMHKNAKPAALATAAAHQQGKFWQMHDKLFELNHLLGDDSTYTGVAKGLGLDLAKFDADRKGPAVEARVMAEAKLAADLDARGTPSYFVNGRKQVGWGSAMGIKSMIDSEKREVEKLMAAGKSREEAIRERVKANSDPGTAEIAVKAFGL